MLLSWQFGSRGFLSRLFRPLCLMRRRRGERRFLDPRLLNAHLRRDLGLAGDAGASAESRFRPYR